MLTRRTESGKVSSALEGASMMTIVDRPGYFGKKREKKIELYDGLFGIDNWKECWEVEGKILCFDKAVALYDEAYFVHLQSHPEIVEFIITFGECYDNDPSNIKCGTTHDQTACPRHIQDISVRRALRQLGVWFKGQLDSLLEIRGPESNGFHLNPGNVPFNHTELILTEGKCGKCPKWAQSGSVEHFWQSNKVIVADTIKADTWVNHLSVGDGKTPILRTRKTAKQPFRVVG